MTKAAATTDADFQDEATPEAHWAKKVAAFIVRVSAKRRGGHRCFRFSLHHELDDQTLIPVTLDVLTEAPETAKPEEKDDLAQQALNRLSEGPLARLARAMAEMFVEAATDRMGKAIRRQDFQVSAYNSCNLESDPLDTTKFWLDPTDADGMKRNMEGPDAAGQTMTIQRHAEMAMTQLVKVAAVAAENAVAGWAESGKERAQFTQGVITYALGLQTNNQTLMASYERAASEQSTRNHNEALVRHKIQRDEQILQACWQMAQKLGPMIANMVADKGGTGPAVKLFKKLSEDKDRFWAIYSALPEEEKALVKETWATYTGVDLLGPGPAPKVEKVESVVVPQPEQKSA